MSRFNMFLYQFKNLSFHGMLLLDFSIFYLHFLKSAYGSLEIDSAFNILFIYHDILNLFVSSKIENSCVVSLCSLLGTNDFKVLL